MPRSSTVDERVVEMRLDNENFESGAKTTISTLEKLERALHLKGDSSGIDEVQRSMNRFDASPMTGALEKAQASFSALEIAGMKVIANLTDSIYEFATKTIKSFTVDPVSMGWTKFGEKTTAVATLTAQGYELEKVNALMEDLNWFTDETSYNFTDMVGNIAKFTATGQDLDQSVTAMEGIALWAALSGQNATKASQAMYQLSQAMGKGALKYDDYKSIQNASMDTQEFRKQAVAAAEELGVLKQTAEGVWEVVGQNKTFDLAGLFSSDALSRTMWFNSDVMMNVFNKYSKAVGEIQRFMEENDIDTASEAMKELEEAATELAETAGITLDEAFQRLGYDLDEFSLKALKAGQNARTWTDVVDSVKDAVSTGWMNTFEIIFGNAEKATEFWTNLANVFYDMFAEGGNTRNDILKIAFGQTSVNTGNFSKAIDGWENLKKKIGESGHTIEEFEDACKTVFSASDSANLSTIIDRYGSIEEAFKNGAISADQFRQIMSELTGETYDAAESLDTSATAMGQSLTELRNVALGILRGDYKDGDERIAMLEELGYDYELLQAMAGDLNNGWENMSDEQLMSMMESYYQAQHLSERLGAETFAEYLANQQAIADGFERPRDEIDEMYDALIGVVGVEEDIVSAEENAIDRGELFRQGILNILNAVMNIKNVFDAAFENVFGDVETRGKRLGQLIEKFHAFTENIGFSEDALEGLRVVIEAVFGVLKNLGSVGKGAFGIVGKAAMEVFGLLDDILSMIGKSEFSIGGVLSALKQRFDNLVPSAEDVKLAFSSLGEKIKNSLPTEATLLKFWDDLKTTFDGIKKSLKDGTLWKSVKEYIPSLSSITAKSKELGTYLQTTYPGIIARFNEWKESHSVLSNVVERTKNAFKSLTDWVGSLNINMDSVNTVFNQFATIISTIFGALFGDPKELEAKISALFTTVKAKLKEEFSKFTFGDFLNSLKTAGLLVMVSEIVGILNKIRNVAAEFGTIGEELKKSIQKLGGMFDDLGRSFRANAYLKIAAAIGILALALWGLSKIPEDDLAKAAAALSLVVLTIALLAKQLDGALKIFGDKNTGNMTGNKITVFSNFASALIGFGMVLAAIAGVILVARNVNMWQLAGIFAGVGILMAEMAIIAKYMADLQFENAGGVIGSFIAIAAALDLMIPVMLVMGLLPWQKALQAGVGVIALLGVLTIVTNSLSKNVVDGGKLLAAAGSMAIMAVALDLLIPILLTFAALDWKGLALGAAGVAAGLILLGGALALMAVITTKLGVSGGTMLAIAGAMALMAVAFAILTPALVTFVGVMLMAAGQVSKMEGFGKALLKLAGFAVVLIAFGVVMALISVALVLFGAAVLIAGVGVVVLAAGLLLLSVAMLALKDSFPVFIECMTKLSENWKKMIGGVVVLGLMAAAMVLLATGLKKLTEITGLNTFFQKLGSAIVNGGKSLITNAIALVKSIGTSITTFIKDNGDVIMKVLKGVILLAGAFLIGLIPTIVDTIVQTLLTIINTVANSIRNNSGAFLHAITNALEALLELVVEALGFAVGTLAKTVLDLINSMLIGINNMIINSLKGGGFWVDIAALFGLDVDGMILKLEEANEQFSHAGDEVRESVQGLTDDVKGYLRENFIAEDKAFVPTEATEESITNMNNMRDAAHEDLAAIGDLNTASLNSDNVVIPATEGAAAIDNETESLGRFAAMRNALENSDIDFSEFNIDISSLSDVDVESLFNGITSRVKEAAGSVPEASGEGVAENTSVYETALNQMAEEGALSMYQASKDSDYPAAAGDAMTYNTAEGANDASEKYMPVTGSNIVASLADSILSNKQYAYNAGYETAGSVDQGVRDRLNIHSPSRVMMKLGGYTIAGFVKGLSKEQGNVLTEAKSIGNTLTDSIKKSIADIALLANEDFSISPVITPVVDMSNVNSAASSVSGAFSGGSYSFSGEISSSVGRRLAQAERISANAASNNSVLNSNDNLTFNIYASNGMDENAIADAVMERMGSRFARRGVAYG